MFQTINMTVHEPRDQPLTGIAIGPTRHFNNQHTGREFFSREVTVGGTTLTVIASTAEALQATLDHGVKEV